MTDVSYAIKMGTWAFQQKLDVLSNSFVDNMMTMDDDIEEMIVNQNGEIEEVALNHLNTGWKRHAAMLL